MSVQSGRVLPLSLRSHLDAPEPAPIFYPTDKKDKRDRICFYLAQPT
ncbi:MAG: hypothetical protein RIE73_01395 [Coleofasciculus sp. C1-SOL-03]